MSQLTTMTKEKTINYLYKWVNILIMYIKYNCKILHLDKENSYNQY